MCTKKEISEAIKNLPYNLSVEDIIFEMSEAPEIFAKCCGNLNEILYTTHIRKLARQSEEDFSNGNSITLEDSKKQIKEELNEYYNQ